MADSKIRSVTAYEVVVPTLPGAVNSAQTGAFLAGDWERLPICLIEVAMEDGLTGLGEVGRGVTLASLTPGCGSCPACG